MPLLQEILQAAVGPAFEIGRELPGAGMSRVFLAREPALGRDVVVKVLPPDLVSATSLQRFTREVQVTARLQHPHILPVITAGGSDDLRFYVTPFIRGESLRARLASGEPLSFPEAVRVGDQLLNAIAFAHAHGVIHRDVKPGNILLSEGHAILADFGIAAIVEAEHPAEHHDHVTGSTLDSGRVYVAPEQPRDEQRDLFAAAVVIHEMATGVAGTAGLSPATITSALRARHPRAAVADARKLAAILARGLATDPAARYQTAAELRTAVQSIGRGSRRPILVGIGVGGVAALLALSTFALRPSPAPVTPSPASMTPDLVPAPDTTPSAALPIEVPQQGSSTPSVVTSPTPVPMAAVDSAEFLFRRGDLGGASSLFAAAVAADVASSRAQLGVAITSGMLTGPAEQEAARIAATRALDGKPGLDSHDRAIAEGFIALADRRYPDACGAFERARDARASFEAWMGLGECLVRDDAVVFGADGAPAFRAGYSTAFQAFTNAIRAAAPRPPAIVYRRLAQTVPQSNADIRMGRTPDNRTFAGNWKIINDTLGFVLGQSGMPRAIPPQVFADAAEAARVGRDQLRPLLLSWVKQSPDEPSAHEMLALSLEHAGVIAELGDDRISAITAIAQARALERNPTNALRLAATHARLMLRARQFTALADLADSLLAAHPTDATRHAETLMPLAFLTGRVERATEFLSHLSGTSARAVRGADGRPVELPATVVRERADYIVRATLGVCDDRVKSAPARLQHLLAAAFPGGVPRGVEASFLERATLFALPCLGPSAVNTLREPGFNLPFWSRAFDPNDATFGAQHAALIHSRPPMTPGAEYGVDGAMVDVVARVAVKDTVGALRILTLALDRVPMSGRGLLVSEWTVGSIVRGMALAAELAAATGDRQTAERWGSAIVTLWRNADPELKPQVDRIRASTGVTSPDRSRE